VLARRRQEILAVSHADQSWILASIGESFAAFAAYFYFSIKVGGRTTERTAQHPNVRQPNMASRNSLT
jgi:hypothetical protein